MANDPQITLVNATQNRHLAIGIFLLLQPSTSSYNKNIIVWQIIRPGFNPLPIQIPPEYEIQLSYPYQGGIMMTNKVTFIGDCQDITVSVSGGGALTISGEAGSSPGTVNVNVSSKVEGPINILFSKAGKQIIPGITSNSGMDTKIEIERSYYFLAVVEDDSQDGDTIRLSQIQDRLTAVNLGQTATVTQTPTSAYAWDIS